VAALLAMLTGLAVARRITRPVEKIIAVTRAMGRGQRAARVGQVTAPGELRELAAAFDQMADTLDRQDKLRRDLVADVAHELRTPVAVLQAGHEALLDGVAEPTPGQLASLRFAYGSAPEGLPRSRAPSRRCPRRCLMPSSGCGRPAGTGGASSGRRPPRPRGGRVRGLDRPSSCWLGHHASSPKVQGSGLWNSDHVEDDCDPGFLTILTRLVGHAQ
jgi:HAMP domain-containing protein